MKAWTRRQIDQLCSHLQDTLGSAQLSDDIPEPLRYGQTASEGAGTKASRSDHRHALSAAIFGAIPTAVLDLSTNESSMNTQLKLRNNIFGSNTGLIGDSAGTSGAFGLSGVNFAVGLAGENSHIALSNSRAGNATGDLTDRIHSVQRLSIGTFRVLTRSTATPASYKAAVGGIHETVNNDLDTIDDGLYFYIEKDGAGAGNWRAVAKSSTTGLSTDIDLGVAPAATAAGAFQNLLITYDLTTATFYIDGVALAEITDNIPTAKVFGWGLFVEKTVNTPSAREVWLDDVIFLGRF